MTDKVTQAEKEPQRNIQFRNCLLVQQKEKHGKNGWWLKAWDRKLKKNMPAPVRTDIVGPGIEATYVGWTISSGEKNWRLSGRCGGIARLGGAQPSGRCCGIARFGEAPQHSALPGFRPEEQQPPGDIEEQEPVGQRRRPARQTSLVGDSVQPSRLHHGVRPGPLQQVRRGPERCGGGRLERAKREVERRPGNDEQVIQRHEQQHHVTAWKTDAGTSTNAT